MFTPNQTIDICYPNHYFNKNSTYCQNFSESSDSLSNQSSPTMPNNYYEARTYTPNYMGDYEMSDEGIANLNNDIKPPTINRGGRKQVKIGTTKRNTRERNRVRYINNCFEVLREHIPIEMASEDKNHKLSKVETLKYAAIYIQKLADLLASTETHNDQKIDVKSEPTISSSIKKIKNNKNLVISRQENISTISYNNININVYENHISNSPSPVHSSNSPSSTASSVSMDYKFYNQEISPNNYMNPYFNCSKSSLYHLNSLNNYENVSNRQMHYGNW